MIALGGMGRGDGDQESCSGERLRGHGKTDVCWLGIKTPFSFEHRDRSAGSAAPPKIFGDLPASLKLGPSQDRHESSFFFWNL